MVGTVELKMIKEERNVVSWLFFYEKSIYLRREEKSFRCFYAWRGDCPDIDANSS